MNSLLIYFFVILVIFWPAVQAVEKVDLDKVYLDQLKKCLEINDYKNSSPLFRKLAKAKKPEIVLEAGYLEGKLYFDLGQPEKAVKAWQTIIIPAQETVWLGAIQLGLGDIARVAGDNQKAKQIYEKYIREGIAGEYMFECAMRLGDMDFEAARFKAALKNYKEAELIARRSIYFSDDILQRVKKQIHLCNKQLELIAKGADRILFEAATKLRKNRQWDKAQVKFDEIVKSYPESIFIASSRWAIGECLAGQEQIKEALDCWNTFINEEPEGPWRGQAYISIGDVFLEKKFNFKASREQFNKALEIYMKEGSKADSWKDTAYAIFQRQGIMEYISNNDEEAIQWFLKASKESVPSAWIRATPNTLTGIEVLITKMQRGNVITPKYVREGSGSSSLILTLADIYHETQEWKKARHLYELITNDNMYKPSNNQKAWAFYQSGRIANNSFKFKDAIALYSMVVDQYGKSPCADEALLRIGVVHVSNLFDGETAIKYYRKLLKEYPKSNEAIRAEYYIADVQRWMKNYESSIKGYEKFLKKYPKEGYERIVKREIKEMQELIANKGNK